jgi:small subunit ribosomal protein S16
MLKIRLQRVGRKHEPTFRVVLTDSKNSTKSGRFREVLGSYDPRKKTEVFEGDRIKEWMGKGAQVSGTVHNLLVSHKIITGKKINVLPKKSPILKEKSTEEAQAGDQTPVEKAETESTVSEAVAEAAPSEVTAEPVANPEIKDESTPAPELPITPEEKA